MQCSEVAPPGSTAGASSSAGSCVLLGLRWMPDAMSCGTAAAPTAAGERDCAMGRGLRPSSRDPLEKGGTRSEQKTAPGPTSDRALKGLPIGVEMGLRGLRCCPPPTCRSAHTLVETHVLQIATDKNRACHLHARAD